MQAFQVSWAFCAALLLSLAIKLWLASRQIRHVHAHRDKVPDAFNTSITLDAHQLAAHYTIARTRFGMFTEVFNAVVLIAWTLLGGLELLNEFLLVTVQPEWGNLAYELALFGVFGLISALLELPFEWYRTFRIEQHFGFNRMRSGLFWADQLKGLLVGTIIGAPLLAAVLWIMHETGAFWWLWAWLLWSGFMLIMQVIYPTVIAPLFNQFKPLTDPALVERVQALMQRCGFKARGLFVMDGSRRSAHGNAYFAGMGKAKRVVFFDTLLERLQPGEIEAVLAHELGHFHHHHIRRRTLMMLVLSAAGLALLGWLTTQVGFFVGMGVRPSVTAANDALALLLFMMAVPPFLFFVSPFVSQRSRHDEFQADAYASRLVSSTALSSALLKLYQDNASTLTPDPVYARFYYSHPPASERLAALDAAT
jgi:STE24 endopeptidase